MDKLEVFSKIKSNVERNTIGNRQCTLAIIGEFLQRRQQATDAAISNYRDTLFEIISNNTIELAPITVEEIIGVDILNACCCTVQEILDAKSEVDFDNVLVYQLVKSIAFHDERLLQDLKPLQCNFINKNNVNASVKNEVYTFNLIKKVLRVECLKEKFESKVTVKSKDVIGMIAEFTSRYMSMYVQHANIVQRSYGDFYRRTVTNKLAIYGMYLAISKIAGTLILGDMTGKVTDLEKVQDICRGLGLTINNAVMRNLCVEGSLIIAYNNYCTKLAEKIQQVEKGSEPVLPSAIDLEIRELRRDIKQLRGTLYAIKQKNRELDIEEDSTHNNDDFLFFQEEEQELRASEFISVYEKLAILKTKKVALVTCIELDSRFKDYCKVIDDGRVYDANLASYDYVVKVTKCMPHSLAYAINERISGSTTKLITTSRTNINLILDSIIDEM